MKKMKKLTSILLALLMTMLMVVPAFATGNNSTTDATNPGFSITIQKPANLSIAGQTFTAYKIFDVTYSDVTADGGNYSYTISDAFKEYSYQGKSGAALIEAVGKLTSGSTELNAFAEDALKWAKDHVSNAPHVTVPEDDVNVAQVKIENLEAGYYLVSGSGKTADGTVVQAACSLDTTNPSVTITPKADAPTLDKVIVENNTGVKANEGSVGDTVTFKLTSKVPAMVGYEKYFFIVHDTLSKGLTFDEGSVSITIGSGKTAKTLGSSDFTATTSNHADATTEEKPDLYKDGTDLEIVFNNFLQYVERVGEDIVITYTAKINQSAVIGVVGNPNAANLEYSNNPNVTPKGENKPDQGETDVTGKTPNSTTLTYVSAIELTKIDGTTKLPLKGAEFTITGDDVNQVGVVVSEKFDADENGKYYKLNDGTYTETAPIEDVTDDDGNVTTKGNANLYEKTEAGDYAKYTKTVKTDWQTKDDGMNVKALVGDDGVLRLSGLGAGTYTISESKIPDGYNKIEDFTVKIEFVKPENVTTGSEQATWKYTISGLDKEDQSGTADGGVITFNVANFSGAELPSTGGIGTTIFYTLGGLMVLGAGIVLIARKRMGKQ